MPWENDWPGGALSPKAVDLVERGNLDGLTAHVGDLATAHDWSQLDLLCRYCRTVLERGKQLWGVAAYIEYRLCLEAPGQWAARTLENATARFALGPLPEVAASSHSWAELAPYLHATPQAAMAAHERVVRGEDLHEDAVALEVPPVLDLPLRLVEWEPSYAVAEYGPDKVFAPTPPLAGRLPAVPLTAQSRTSPNAGSSEIHVRDVVAALEELASVWTAESNGRAEAVAVEGNATDAVRALGAKTVEIVSLSPAAAIAHMAWAAANGGAHGRRRGGAAGRFGAWGVLAALSGTSNDWATSEHALGEVAAATRWFAWSSGEPVTGWSLRLALETEAGAGLAFALTAIDAF